MNASVVQESLSNHDIIKFHVLLSKIPTEIHQLMSMALGQHCPAYEKIRSGLPWGEDGPWRWATKWATTFCFNASKNSASCRPPSRRPPNHHQRDRIRAGHLTRYRSSHRHWRTGREDRSEAGAAPPDRGSTVTAGLEAESGRPLRGSFQGPSSPYPWFFSDFCWAEHVTWWLECHVSENESCTTEAFIVTVGYFRQLV